MEDLYKNYYFSNFKKYGNRWGSFEENSIILPENLLGLGFNTETLDNYSIFFGQAENELELLEDNFYNLDFKDLGLESTYDFDDELEVDYWEDHVTNNLLNGDVELDESSLEYILDNYGELTKFNLNMENISSTDSGGDTQLIYENISDLVYTFDANLEDLESEEDFEVIMDDDDEEHSDVDLSNEDAEDVEDALDGFQDFFGDLGDDLDSSEVEDDKAELLEELDSSFSDYRGEKNKILVGVSLSDLRTTNSVEKI